MSILCVPITEKDPAEILDSIHSLPPEVPAVEVRLDYLQSDNIQMMKRAIDDVSRQKNRAVILTIRPERTSCGVRLKSR